MNDLLAFAIDAHGGLDRWSGFAKVAADVSIDGAVWHLKQVPGILLDKTFEVDTRDQRVVVSPYGGHARLVYTPRRLAIEAADGTVVASRDDPEPAFAGQTADSAWDELHVGFFAGEAMWTYLTLPFLYATPGFVVEEIEPWHEDGEVWRSLRVTFPDHVTSHTKTQITRFGPDGLMRRHDYTVDILGGARGVNYSSAYRVFQGIGMPTRRRVYAYDDALRKVPEPLLVSIDIRSLVFS